VFMLTVASTSPWIALQTVPERGMVTLFEPFKFWWAPTISLEWLIVSGAVDLGGRCGKQVTVIGHQFITLTVDTCVQHGGHESLRRAGLAVAVETCFIFSHAFDLLFTSLNFTKMAAATLSNK